VIFTHFATPPTIPNFYRAQCVPRAKKKKRAGRENSNVPSIVEKNRDTGGVTCMESYVGNTPPNEQFSLWDVCFMCFFGAAAKRYGSLSPNSSIICH
jgi:hypothetical protein